MPHWQVTQPISKEHARLLSAWVWHLTAVAFTFWFILCSHHCPSPPVQIPADINRDTVTLLVHLSQLSSELFSNTLRLTPAKVGALHGALCTANMDWEPQGCGSYCSRHHKPPIVTGKILLYSGTKCWTFCKCFRVMQNNLHYSIILLLLLYFRN